MTTATRNEQYTAMHATEPVLFLAFELSEKTWKLGCTTGHGQQPRERSIAARHQARLLHEVAQAKRRCGLPETAPVVSGYAAGREGFWLHRFLQAHGIINHVVDSSSIEVKRRKRRAKSDGLDVRKLLTMLIRSHYGARSVWRVVNVPSIEAEDQRHLHRDLDTKPSVQTNSGRCAAQRRTRLISRRIKGRSRCALTSPPSHSRVFTIMAMAIQTIPLCFLTRSSSACTCPRSRGCSTRYSCTAWP
jgi:transposase